MSIHLTYGNKQKFRYRHRDINILGRFNGTPAPGSSFFTLNQSKPQAFFIKFLSSRTLNLPGNQSKGPSVNRLVNNGDFNIEIPVTHPGLQQGENQISLTVTDQHGRNHGLDMMFRWDPAPVPPVLDLRDLTKVKSVQDVGQVVDGAFEVDSVNNVIRAKSPVSWDTLFLLGSPYGCQEATYNIRFSGKDSGHFLGLSEFFAGHEAESPDVIIKPGWSSAGLATLRPNGHAQAWLAWGDLTKRKEFWVKKTDPGPQIKIQIHTLYSVRHQVLFEKGINSVRFKIWEHGTAEPQAWLCQENDCSIPDSKPKFTKGSFGLFQHGGPPSEWSNIILKPIH